MFRIYKNIFNKITGKEKPKRKTMARKKLLSPQQKANILAKIKSGAGKIIKTQGTAYAQKFGLTPATARPTVTRTAVKVPKPPPTVKVKPMPIKKVKPVSKPAPKPAPIVIPEKNFWKDRIDMGFIKPTGTQLVIGGTATVIGGALLIKAIRR